MFHKVSTNDTFVTLLFAGNFLRCNFFRITTKQTQPKVNGPGTKVAHPELQWHTKVQYRAFKNNQSSLSWRIHPTAIIPVKRPVSNQMSHTMCFRLVPAIASFIFHYKT